MDFVSPEAILKQTPSIKDVIQDPKNTQPQAAETAPSVQPAQAVQAAEPVQPVQPIQTPEVTQSQPAQPEQGPIAAPIPPEKQEPEETQAEVASPPAQETPPITTNQVDQLNPKQYDALFLQKWNDMISIVFNKVPTLQAPLKHYTPVIKDFVIHLTLKNEFQIEDFASKKSDVLQYMRNNFDERINDVETKMDKQEETHNYILTEDDILMELKRENPDFNDFIKALNLRIKG